MTMDDAELSILESFEYRRSEPHDYVRYKIIGDSLRAAAEAIILNAPDCADRTTALRCLREARMWANAAVNLKGLI